MADIVPKGLKNNYRWQSGHINASFEGLLFHFTNEQVNLPEG